MTDPSHPSDVRLAQTLGTVEAPPTASKSSGSQPVEITARPATPVPVAWRSWPIVDSLADLLLLTVGIGGTIGVAYRFAGPLTAIVSAVALTFVCWRNFVPTVYELSALGVSENCVGRKRRIPWISIDRYVVGRRGVFLSSAGAPLELLRGLYLPWGTHREQILAVLRYYLPRAEETHS
jgi:hypothetical protein